MTVRVGVVGTGIMGADHANTLHRMVSGVEVTLVADVDLGRAQRVADLIPGAGATHSAHALIAADAVDAVVIAAHDSTHAELVTAAVRAGKPVLCEKPLAPTVAECAEVVRAERAAMDAAGITVPLVSLGFMRRFDPGYLQMKQALDTGVCGSPVLMHCISRGVSSAPGATDESSVTGSAIHEFDIVPWLLGAPITEVSWHSPSRPRRSRRAQFSAEGESGRILPDTPQRTGAVDGFQDPQLMLLRTADGVLSTVEVFLNARYGYDVRCEIVGEHGTLALTEPARVIVDKERGRTVGYPADWRPRFADAYRIELQAWIDAIGVGGRSTLATAHDGLVAGAVAEAVIASMHSGRQVAVEVPEV